LSHGSHCFFVFTDFLWDPNKHTKFWGKVDILSLLLDFKQRLIKAHNLLVVLLTEVLNHGDSLTCFTLFETGSLWTHVPTNLGYFICFVVTVAGHNYGVFKLIIDSFLNFSGLWRLSGEALAFLCEAHHLFIN